MKRTYFAPVALLGLGLLSACAGTAAPAAAQSETPQQSLTATGTAMATVQSARFDANGTATLTLPQALVDQLRAAAGTQGSLGSVISSTMTVTFKLTGAARRPDQVDATITASLGGLTINTEVIADGGQLYYKNPMTAKWEAVRRPAGGASETAKSGSAYQALLDTAKSVTEVTGQPSTLDGVAVDHYQIVPDLVRLFAQLTSANTPKNPQALTAIQGLLQNASVTADVWTGSGDHLVRRLTYDTDVTADASQLAATLGSSTSGLTIPAGSTVHVTAHAEVNLHNYNEPVTITPPTITP
ncbi:MAG TPA: hypothetical protein VET65_11120 [Candidatus Limnocylindrales bacterium]|nr:hypothetical protein [Candidatus Limnocylindrales bacterium]